MREIYDPLFKAKGWFSPLLTPPGWFEKDLVEAPPVEGPITLNAFVTEGADTLIADVRVPRRVVPGGGSAGFTGPATGIGKVKERITLDLYVRERPDRLRATVTVPVSMPPVPPPSVTEVLAEVVAPPPVPVQLTVAPPLVPVPSVEPVRAQMLAREKADTLNATASVTDWVAYDNEMLLNL